MLWSEATGEVAVRPGTIQVIVHVIASGGVTDPLPIVVNVRGFGMAFMVAVAPSVLRGGALFGNTLFLRTLFGCSLLLRMLLGTALFLGTPLVRMWHGCRFRPTIGNTHAWAPLGRPLMFVMLCHCRQREQNTNRKKSENVLHHFQPSTIRVSEVFCEG
jgi:hypothetical protein